MEKQDVIRLIDRAKNDGGYNEMYNLFAAALDAFLEADDEFFEACERRWALVYVGPNGPSLLQTMEATAHARGVPGARPLSR